jgi:hypothetical protein
MSIIPTPGNLTAQLMHLIASPRVQYSVDQFKRMLPQAAGPLRASTSHMPTNHRGASLGSNTPGNSGAIGSALGNSIGSAIASLGQQQQIDPLQALYEQLVNQLQTPVAQPQAVDKTDLMNQVKAAINPIYDAREKTATDQTQRATGQVKDMYGALAKDYEKLAPQQIAQAKDAQDQISQLYGQLRSNIEGTYSRVSTEQADLFKQLGIQDALPDVLADQAAPVQDASVAASENQAQQQQRYMDIGQMDSSFYREGSPNALATGNEVSSDLLSQLQSYIQNTEGERSSGIQSGYMDQLGQANSLLAQQQQQATSQTNQNQQMLWQMLQSQLQGKNQAQQQALTPDTYMSQLDPDMQQSVAGAFTQLQRSPEAVYGKVEDPRNPVPGTYVDTSPEWYMQQADAMLQNGQIDPVTHQALLMYMQLYFGMGK